MLRMGYAILRVERRASPQAAAAMLRHALREDAPPNAIPGAPRPVPIAGSSTSAEAMARLNAAIAKAKEVRGGWQKNSVRALDLLVTMSRDDGQRLTKDQKDWYFRKALNWIAERFGGAQNILTACVHRDETTDHMQVLLMPIDQHGRFSASTLLGNRTKMSEMQDSFWETCGKPARLQRGVKRTYAKHVPVRALYGAMDAGEDPPKFIEVPPEPSLQDQLAGRKAAMLEARKEAVEHNARERRRMELQAQNGRKLHPRLISRQADRYRELATAESRAKQAAEAARSELQAVKKANAEAAALREGIRQDSAILDLKWNRSNGAELDKWSVHMRPEMVAHLASSLRIELVAGRPLLDQMRRQGRGRTMVEAAEIADKILNGELHRHITSSDAQRQIDRDKGQRGG